MEWGDAPTQKLPADQKTSDEETPSAAAELHSSQPIVSLVKDKPAYLNVGILDE